MSGNKPGLKALEAGYGNSPATMVNVAAELKEDCKLFNSMKTVPVASTVHEENRRTSHGDYRFLSTNEGGKSRATDQAVERVFYEQKYLQTKRSVTLQMEKVRTFEDAYTSEKIAGVEVICKGAEYNMFHGDAAVVPTDFDGFPAAIRKSANPNIIDLRGASLGSGGEGLFDDAAQQVWDRGGDVSKVFFPSRLARDVKDLFTDRLCMMVKDKQATFDQIPDYPAAKTGNTVYTGLNANLPGTASMLFLTENRITPVYSLGQLLPVTTYPLYPHDAAVTPFPIILFCALEAHAPEFCALVDNISYQGGL
jgi:hypothetical protein